MDIFLNDLVGTYEVAGNNLFDALIGEARVIFWMLALMSTVWSLILLASGKINENLTTHFGRHLLFFGFFGGLFLERYQQTLGAIPRLLHQAGSQSLGADTFLNPDQILTAGFGLAMRLIFSMSTFSLLEQYTLAIRFFGAVVMMITFIFIALKVTQVLIEQHIAVLGIGVFLFAFTGSRWTWSVGESLIRYAVHLGIRLMMLVVIFDVGKSLIVQWTDALTGSFLGPLDLRTWFQIIVGSITFAFITWTIPDRVANQLAQRIQFNNPHTP